VDECLPKLSVIGLSVETECWNAVPPLYMLAQHCTYTHTHMHALLICETNVNKNKVRMTVALLTATVFPAEACFDLIRRQGEIVYLIQQ